MTLDEFVAALMDCGGNGDAPVLVQSPVGDWWLTPVAVVHDDGRVIVEMEAWSA